MRGATWRHALLQQTEVASCCVSRHSTISQAPIASTEAAAASAGGRTAKIPCGEQSAKQITHMAVPLTYVLNAGGLALFAVRKPTWPAPVS